MHLLTFTAGGQTYAIEATSVVEVLPNVPLRPLPRVPEYVAGVFGYRGRMIPVVDLSRRLTGTPAVSRLSTRLIVVEFAGGAAAGRARLGILAENVVSTSGIGDGETVFPSLHLETAPYLGRILRLQGQNVQMLLAEHLLPPAITASLLAGGGEPVAP